MPGNPTPNLGLTVPTVGGDANSWGAELNTDLLLLDGLGVSGFVNENSNFAAAPGFGPEITYRVTTGAVTIVATLPAANTCSGKIFTFKKIDSGTGQISIVGSIDGNASWVVPVQYGFVRIQSNGSTFDVIGMG